MKKLVISLCALALMSGCDSSQGHQPSAAAETTSVSPPSYVCQDIAPLNPKKLKPTLWLRADRQVRVSGPEKSVTSWSSEGGKLELYAPEGHGPTLGLTSKGKPAIIFSGGDQVLRSQKIQGNFLLQPKENSLFLVMEQSSKHPFNDTFAWGDCGKNRFNTHLGAQGQLIVQSGDPAAGQIITKAPKDWNDRLHVVSIVRDGETLRLSVDGAVVGSARSLDTHVDSTLSAPLVIGGICHNGFGGKIAEALLFKTALDHKQECGLIKHLELKYGISSRRAD